MKKKVYFKEKKIAHRGIHEKYLENTIPAFKEAIKRGYAIELDIQFTKDKQIIVFHDENLKRIYGVNKYISFLNYSDLKNYSIPLLKEVLDLVQGEVTLLIEIKWEKRMKQLIKNLLTLLKDYPGEVYFMSFYLLPLYFSFLAHQQFLDKF